MSMTNPSGGTVTDPVVVALDGLSTHGWRMLHTTRWPGHPGQTIEHVAIGPGGVVVVAVPHTTVHDEALDEPQEDLACATSAVTALVAPRHRRSVRGVLVVPPGVEAPTLAEVVDSEHLAGWLTTLDPVLSPLEVVLVSAYLRDKLDPVAAPRATRVPQPAPPVDDAPTVEEPEPPAVPEPPAPRRRPGLSRRTALIVAAGLALPWVVAGLLYLF
ncbi:MAG: hypothetical protein FWD18_04190 [Micrococcales bacterium]|nr:hypothetical protein [Micrococcales bacterium]